MGELSSEPLLQTKPEADDSGVTKSWHEPGCITHDDEQGLLIFEVSNRCQGYVPCVMNSQENVISLNDAKLNNGIYFCKARA